MNMDEFKSRTGLNFFRPCFNYCLSGVHYCEDRFHIRHIGNWHIGKWGTYNEFAMFSLPCRKRFVLLSETS